MGKLNLIRGVTRFHRREHPDVSGVGSAGDLVAGVLTNRVFNGVPTALRAAKADEDAMQPLWGQRFGAAAELPLGAELYASAGNTGDLVAGVLTNRAFNGIPQYSRKC